MVYSTLWDIEKKLNGSPIIVSNKLINPPYISIGDTFILSSERCLNMSDAILSQFHTICNTVINGVGTYFSNFLYFAFDDYDSFV
jgi:hypothetical protein